MNDGPDWTKPLRDALERQREARGAAAVIEEAERVLRGDWE